MAALRSEADFSEPDLPRERRWLALFLLVHLVDEHGRMSTAYRRLIRRAARVPGHWAHGRSLGAVRTEVSRLIGVNARTDSVPTWEWVADLVHLAVHPRLAPGVLATARHLHGLVTGEPNDAPRPRWLDPAVENVTTAMIGGPEWARKHGLPAPAITLSAIKRSEVPQVKPLKTEQPAVAQTRSARSEVPRLAPDIALLHDLPADGGESPDRESTAYEMLWTVVRVHRDAQARIAELEHQVRELHEENARLSGDVTTWLGGYRPTIPDQDRGTRPRRPVADRHLALQDPARAFTYPLPADLPSSGPTAS
ncbi:hypothetical protein AB0G02_09680 [Actinosynnema sp. NPDC023658]|uniref:hypothetical protein n=1 Tax=Actinosynnema sp. NPDC023658 TaxID=3155465 RepID=UPI0033F88304